MTLNKLIAEFRLIDHQILHLIRKRMKCARQAGKLKKQLGIPIRNIHREHEATKRARQHARKLGINPDLAERIVKILITASRNAQHHA